MRWTTGERKQSRVVLQAQKKLTQAWHADFDLAIKTTWPSQGLIQCIRPIGRCDDKDPAYRTNLDALVVANGMTNWR